MLDFLVDIGTITTEKKEDILYQLALPPPSTTEKVYRSDNWSLTSRKDSTRNSLNKRLLEIMNKVSTCFLFGYLSKCF